MTSNTANNRAVLTLAAGPVVYWNMAVNLARSIRLWHSPENLPISIATDHDGPLPSDLAGVSILKLKPGELGKGFQTKLHLDRLAPAQCTLFIDSDCLVYASLDSIFKKFSGQAVGIVREGIASQGERFGDIAEYCRILGVNELPLFTGGTYYLETPAAIPVFEEARRLLPHYDEHGRVRLRGLPNEEVLLSAAMAKHNLWGIPDDGEIIGDFQTCPGPHSLNLVRGRRVLSNPSPDNGPQPHCSFAPVRSIQPAIVHFLAYHTHLPAYRSEVRTLTWMARSVPRSLADFASRLTILVPGLGLIALKNLLRPLYRRLFGLRNVPPTDRTTA